jgi:hypothetical protein
MDLIAASDDIVRILGPLDDLLLAEILETRASVPELIEARERLWTQNGALRDQPPRSERVIRVLELLHEATAEEPEEDEQPA